MSPDYFFMLVSAVTFCYEWIPNVMANFLVYLGTFPTWIAPNNVAVNQAFGGVTGIGILPISLDWSGVAVSTHSSLFPVLEMHHVSL